jgi:phospholipid/cholesterol/gamma-HCH transport system substrate-binding protein
VLILSAGLLSAGLWLSVGFNQKTYSLYTVYLHEAASGLSEESPVKYNGVQVGFVKSIKINKNDPRQVEITLSIEEGTPITTSTSATLLSQGITGVTYVGLSAGSSDLTPLKKMPDEPYPVIPAKPSLFNQLDSLLRQASDDVSKVSAQIQRVFNKENARFIRKTLANISKASQDFPDLMKELKVSVNKFNSLATDLSKAGTSISKTMNSGKNAIDEVGPQTTTLIRRLNAISANLEHVSNEMRQNPSVVIRGTTPPKPGPGE